MPGKTKYSDEPFGRVRVISDFLPPASDLVYREEGLLNRKNPPLKPPSILYDCFKPGAFGLPAKLP